MSRNVIKEILAKHPAPWTLEAVTVKEGASKIVALYDAKKLVIACSGAVPGVWAMSPELMAAFAILVNERKK